MKTQLMLAVMILLGISTSHPAPIIIPDTNTLKRTLCNAGYRALVDYTDLIKNLKSQNLSDLDVHQAVLNIHEVVEEANKKLLSQDDEILDENTISEHVLHEHHPKVTALILQKSSEALIALNQIGYLSPEVCQELDRRGIMPLRTFQDNPPQLIPFWLFQDSKSPLSLTQRS